MTNQVGPWGSTTYNQTGTTGYTNSQGQYVNIPQYTQTTNYNPAQQAIFDKTTAAQTNIADIASNQSASLKDYLNTGFNFDGGQQFTGPQAATATAVNAPAYQNGQDFSYTNNDAGNWAYDLASQRILPQQQKATDALRTQLTNQGLREGTAAWNNAMLANTQGNNDQLNQLALTGRQQGYNEALGTAQNNYAQNTTDQTNAFSQQLAATGANNASSLAAQQAAYQQALGGRQQNFQEAVTGRNQPINEITALLSGSQIANPNTGTSATPQTQVGGVDYTGMVNNNYNQQVASSNAALGGLFGLAGQAGSAAIKYSDARVKEDIRRVGHLDNGLPVYSYRYVWGGPVEIGLLAQDVARVNPEAVHEFNGVLAVDYARAAA